MKKIFSAGTGLHANRSAAGTAVVFIILLFTSLLMMMPFVYSIVQSLKPMEELFAFPPKFFVQNPTTENYQKLFQLTENLWAAAVATPNSASPTSAATSPRASRYRAYVVRRAAAPHPRERMASARSSESSMPPPINTLDARRRERTGSAGARPGTSIASCTASTVRPRRKNCGISRIHIEIMSAITGAVLPKSASTLS